ncbi:hypothetical protein KVT40_009037 [Elsinoe batatas]|uniref:Uncharacterized protein n=1 Tax=Elsinoe batatas TaxID=2601811 RepID=A0A8K0PC22_9PEZI|nr:hypothetical protein KVT40_009037 [Elsinoe batatas]
MVGRGIIASGFARLFYFAISSHAGIDILHYTTAIHRAIQSVFTDFDLSRFDPAAMCIRVTEVYAGCKCIYYVHGIDACAQYGRHPVEERVVYVGLNCPRHTRRRELLSGVDLNGTTPQRPAAPPIQNVRSSSHDQHLHHFSSKTYTTSTTTSSTCRSAPAEMATDVIRSIARRGARLDGVKEPV